jgi:hypothetical protein
MSFVLIAKICSSSPCTDTNSLLLSKMAEMLSHSTGVQTMQVVMPLSRIARCIEASLRSSALSLDGPRAHGPKAPESHVKRLHVAYVHTFEHMDTSWLPLCARRRTLL